MKDKFKIFFKKGDVKLAVTVFSAILAIIATGVTYAFFSASINNDKNQKVSIKTGTMELTFEDNDDGVKAKLKAGESLTKKFIIKNTGTLDTYGKMKWYELYNGYTNGSLIWKLEESSDEKGPYTVIEKGSVPSSDEIIVDSLDLKAGETKYYNLTITLIDLGDGVDQTPDIDANFHSKFRLEAGRGNGATKIERLAKYGEDDLILNDGTPDQNTRYIGADPNNYVSFNNESWRIIGTFNNIDNGKGVKESRLKITRAEPIGRFSWDTSDSSVNSGWGINEWSNSYAMKLLNSGLYWNGGKGSCYSNLNNSMSECDFSNAVISNEAKDMIDDAVWATGTNDTSSIMSISPIVSEFYKWEKSGNALKLCSGGDECNDSIARNPAWTGKIAIPSASDYGFATSGGATDSRDTCINNLSIYYTNNKTKNWEGHSDCYKNDWLYSSSGQWTLNARASSGEGYIVFGINSTGRIGDIRAGTALQIRPTLYLNSKIIIKDGTGTKDNPYILSFIP